MSNSEQYVYTLSDPRDYMIHYVGITNNPSARLGSHLKNERSSPDKVAWIKRLRSEGAEPLMEIIETVHDRVTVIEREHYWIEYYSDAGMPLTNVVYAPYQNISALQKAIEQEHIRRTSHPEDAPGRWIERLLEKENSPWHELVELTPKAISVLLSLAITGSPSIIDKSVRILVTHIKPLFPYIQHLNEILSLYEKMNTLAHQTGRPLDEIILSLLSPTKEGSEV